MEMRKGERRHIIVVLLIFRCVRFFIKSQTDAGTDFENKKCLGDFYRPHYTTMAEMGKNLPIMGAPMSAKG